MKKILLLAVSMLLSFGAAAQEKAVQNIRYVAEYGSYNNSGDSWDSPKRNVQDAINDLVDKGLTGEVWVAQGTYTPTESTEAQGGSTLYMSFKVPAGITVRGGFFGKGTVPSGETLKRTENGTTTTYTTGNYPGEGSADDRITTKFRQTLNQGTVNEQTVDQDWNYKYPTTLSGNLSQEAKFEWNTTKNYWDASFYGNCYHVVWFAMEGFDEEGRAKPLDTSIGEAAVEGFTIKNGNARNTDLTRRQHNAYGGGVYMAKGSRVENCRILNCEASRDGGGIYMDGGGVVKHCYIFNNQALGIGVQNGYGGGICLDANGFDERFGIYRSVVVGNVGRLGGGLAIKVEQKTGTAALSSIPAYHLPFVSAVLVGNNTATVEGGGVYTTGGGAMTNLTVVRNKCNGSGVISNEMVTGRSGGVYCRDHALILNSVMWGNECPANDDMQYASSKSAVDVENVNMQFCALMKSDYVDWSATSSYSVFNISEYNNYDDFKKANPDQTPSVHDVFANFLVPATKAGYNDNLLGNTDALQSICWMPGPNSALANAGIVSHDLNPDGTTPFVGQPSDILGNVYTSRSTLGAYTRKFGKMTPQKLDLVDADGKPGTDGTEEWHFFVDPNAQTYTTNIHHGENWNSPARFLGNVLHTINLLRAPDYTGENKMAATDKVYVHIKEGTMGVVNSYSEERVRSVSLRVPSNVTILGGYPAQLKDTELVQKEGDVVKYQRNPLHYPTFISGVINNDTTMNTARIFVLNGVNNVTLDGLQIRYANARSLLHGNTSPDGGGIAVRNSDNVKVRNVIIAGCRAVRGAAVYLSDANHTEFENCIFHNNEAKDLVADTLSGVVFVESTTTTTTTTTFRHCNILNNVGHGTFRHAKANMDWINSMAFANMSGYNSVCYLPENHTEADSTAFYSKLVSSLKQYGTDGTTKLTNSLFGDNLQYTIDGVQQRGTLSYVLNKKNAYPRFINGVVNVGVSDGGDVTFYGRSTSFEPHNDNPMVNASSYTGDHTTWGTDMSTVITRDYGGLPDVGAIENHTATNEEATENAYTGGQPAYGNVVYVKEDGKDEEGYGDSWDKPVKTVQYAIEKAIVDGGRETVDVEETSILQPGSDLPDLSTMLKVSWVQIRNAQYSDYYWAVNNNNQITISQTPSELATYFKFEATEDNPEQFYIKVYDEDSGERYITSHPTSAQGLMGVGTGGTKQRFNVVRRQNNEFHIQNTTASSNTYRRPYVYRAQTGSWWSPTYTYSMRVGSSDAQNYAWIISTTEEVSVTMTTEKVIDTNNKQVWVAEGTYTQKSDDADHALRNVNVGGDGVGRVHRQKYSIMLREGVNVYGGFSKTGYPGFEDRNPKLYETIVQPGNPAEDIDIDTKTDLIRRGITDDSHPLEYRANSESCGSYGRVVVQQENFDVETVFDGFTITNGYLNSTARVLINGNLYTVMSQSNNQVGLWGGAGVYLLEGGVIENCVVKFNMTYANPENTSNNAVTAEANNQTYMAMEASRGSCHVVGAGVYNNGGVIKNCIISDNMILFELERRTVDGDYESNTGRHSDAAGLYGAGLFLEKGTVYNTIICNNIEKITNMKSVGMPNLDCHDNPYTDLGKANNEFWHSGNQSGNSGASECHGNQYAAGAGVFLVSGSFYNNTVVNNTYRLWPTYRRPRTVIGIGGVYAYNGATLYNCIIANNEPESFEAAGMADPYTGAFLRSREVYATYMNFPIVCFNTEGSGYVYNDEALTVRNCAVDFKSAEEIWKSNKDDTEHYPVVYTNAIRNQCLENDYKNEEDSTAYFFNTHKSWGYAANGAQNNDSDTNYSSGSGTNWYGKFADRADGTKDESVLYDSLTYKLTLTSPAVNNGTSSIPNVTLPDVDAGYTERIKDCTVDMGAYEFDDSYAIVPEKHKDGVILTASSAETPDSVFYYVTPFGRGLASANNPANAACADKLQRVLDAAGRYKYKNPEVKVVVKVAKSKTMDDFHYYATRTTDEDDSDVRIWSIIVPRGVEVWGGYSDSYDDENVNGFYNKVTADDGITRITADNRSITGNPTNFDSSYKPVDGSNEIFTYHVVTFTDRVFDGEGNPYMNTAADIANLLNDKNSVSGSRAVGDNFLLMGSPCDGYADYGNVTDRAVIDGIHITGGRADLKTLGSGTEAVNINRYGGAAIVTDYAHVRNCIVRDNEGIYGGALALTHGALVTGCLIERNTAEYGGAIYVFENGTVLSNGMTIASDNKDNYNAESQDQTTRWDYNMSHVLLSTIVNNKATTQGGGVWFTDNVRFNSVAVWQNECQDQANVSGFYNVTRQDGQTYSTTEYYPFNYSAIQNIQASGINNVSIMAENKYGMRFYSVDHTDSATDSDRILAVEGNGTGFDRLNDFGYFQPSDYSVLTRGGMPLAEYRQMSIYSDIASTDFLGMPRDISADRRRTFIEIGALASNKIFTDKGLMLRLFVASPEDIDVDAALAMAMAGSKPNPSDLDLYYSQEGSSFAYPFYRLQDALDYIYYQRGLRSEKDEIDSADVLHNANNMSFEIWLGPGTYYPTVDLTGNNENAVGNTFLIPEGVSLVGGYDPKVACDTSGKTDYTYDKNAATKHFYGAYNRPYYLDPFTNNGNALSNGTTGQSLYENKMYYVDSNKTGITDDDGNAINSYSITYEGKTYTLHHVNKDIASAKRPLEDINANSLIETWELKNQTILSGKIEGMQNNGVHHIVTILANDKYAGALPATQGDPHAMFDTVLPTSSNYGYKPHEHGQIVALDGLTFSGGYAYGYKKGSVDNNHKMKYNSGGAILVDGNNYSNSFYRGAVGSTYYNDRAPEYKHRGMMGSVGFREIPVMISRCKFEGNTAGFGGAISSNTTLDVVNSAFEHNIALAGNDTVDYKTTRGADVEFLVNYPGAGGAISGTYQVSAINTLFANNEALDPSNEGAFEYTILSDLIDSAERGIETPKRTMIAGSGGAVVMMRKGHFHMMNCNFVRNQANAYPAIFTVNPNYQHQLEATSLKDYNQAINCVFWGNEVNKTVQDKCLADAAKGQQYVDAIGRIVNYGPADRWDTSKGDVKPYQIGVSKSYHAWTQPQLDKEFRETGWIDDDGANLNDSVGYTEQIWFSAYELGKGKTPKNLVDMRDSIFNPRVHIKQLICNYFKESSSPTSKDGLKYQNCNILLSSDNNVNDGPNFVNPSAKAGYDGYMESADWSPARLNNLTDNGWGKIKQKVAPDNSGEYTTEFLKYGEDGAPALSSLTPADRVGGSNPYSAESDGVTNGKEPTFVIDGAYSAIRYMKGNEKYQKTMPIGDQEYMYTTYNDKNGNPFNLYRISQDPNPTHNQTYIDIGVYEYYHTQLKYKTEGDEVDVLWVGSLEKPDNGLPDGSDWSQPTSDLQRAIETLLSSRNGHRKEIRLLDGTFVPIYTIENHLGFYINTEYQNGTVILDKDTVSVGSATLEYGEGVKSLTFKGGYSYDLDNVRDVEEYPAVIRQQKRTDATSDRWNHLFFIADPTQRYGMENGYTADNGFGHVYGTKKNVRTIPIEFDGVTLVNDQANPNTKGAVIHYADLDSVLVKTNANNTIYTSQNAILADNANVTTSMAANGDHEYYEMEAPAKIIISKTKIFTSGTPDAAGDNRSSAVYLGDRQGGHAILYNNVMHSNYGDPLVAGCRTVTVNNTFALNSGQVKLNETGSTIHNSVFWRNNANGAGYDDQFVLKGFNATGDNKEYNATTKFILSNNSYTGGPTLATDYANSSGDVAKTNYNTSLEDDNTNFMDGPNFIDPENKEEELRNFNIMPSLRLMNRGDVARYDTLKVQNDVMQNTGGNYFYDLALETTYDEDAASMPRFVGMIDVGAYEYQNTLNRVIYVDPNRPTAGSGLKWEDAMGYGSLQDAIDLAALYQLNNAKQAFVFMKGATNSNKELHTGETLTMRDGVSVYGGIHSMFTEECRVDSKTASGENVYTYDDIKKYLVTIAGHHEGFIGPNTNRTAVNGIITSQYTKFNIDDAAPEGEFLITSLMDGFHVTGAKAAPAPLVNVKPQAANPADNGKVKVALRNIVVYDNDMADDVEVAQVDNALIYEALLRSQSAEQTVLRLGSNGWAASITASGKTIAEVGGNDVVAYNGGASLNAQKDNRIVNSIVNYNGQDANAARSETDETMYTLSGWNYVRTDRNMYYQLTEGSKHINEIEIKSGEQGNESLPTHLRQFVNYRTDRDLLGNPRLLTLLPADSSTVKNGSRWLDRGAFETWKIEDKVVRTSSDGHTDHHSECTHFAPHTGSVVYIMEGNSLVCGVDLRPGFLLLKEGANLYGNGQDVQLSFVAVERTIQPTGSVVSLPFPMDYSVGQRLSDGVAIPSYSQAPANKPSEADGILTLKQDPDAEVYSYNGKGRSEWNGKFHYEDSDYWEELDADSTLVPANQGVFFKPSQTIAETGIPVVYSFTSMGESWYNNVYTETPEEKFKEVVLTQYDDHVSDAGGADFTEKEDMGWNCVGVPYLVSNYKTDDASYTVEADAVEYNMNIPHKMWLYYDGEYESDGITVAEGDGGYYCVDSWDSATWKLSATADAHIWVGEGIFMQTAAVDSTETVEFYRPKYQEAESAAKGMSKSGKYNTRVRMADGIEEEDIADFRIIARGRNIYVTGLQGGENITIYDPTGRVFNMAKATGDKYMTSLPVSGVYVVKVNNERKKVLLR